MVFGELLHRLREGLRRKQRAARGKAKGRDGTDIAGAGPNSSPKPHIIHPGLELVHGSSTVKTITRAEMQRSANNQDLSIFFTKLPLELRRQIYREVWRAYLKSRRVTPSAPGSDLRLHIYTDGSSHGTFRHTQCKVHPGAPGQDDAQVIEPWPFNSSNSHTPPMWFWFAWVMRLHWDKHWKCQHAVMKRWDPRTGSAREAEPSPFLPLFLTCKKMYWEAIVSLFENITPVFTSSEDAYRFFLQRPHPFLSNIRSLEFSFTNPNDHLFLAQVQRDVRCNDVAPPPTAPATNPHSCNVVVPCRLEVFGQQLWSELVAGVKTSAPGLRDFDITIGGRMAHDGALAGFGRRHVEDEAEFEAELRIQNAEAQVVEATQEPWTLPGKLAVFFKSDDQRYIQNGTKLIKQ